MEEFNNNDEIAAEQEQKSNRKKEKKDWKSNSILKGFLYMLFIVLAVGVSVLGGVIVYFAKNRIYAYHKYESFDLVAEQILRENANVIQEAFMDYKNMHEMALSEESIKQNRDRLMQYLEQKFEELIGDEFYRFSIQFFPDTDQEIELYGDKYSPHKSTSIDCTSLRQSEIYYTDSWTDAYSKKYTFDTYDAAIEYHDQVENEFVRDETISWFSMEVRTPEIADTVVNEYNGSYPFVTDGYCLDVTYEKIYSVEYSVWGDVTDAYETIPYNGKGHDLLREVERLNWMYDMRIPLLIVTAVFCIVLFVCFLLLMASAGHVPQSKEIRERWFEKIPLEFILVIGYLIIWGTILLVQEVENYLYGGYVGPNMEMLFILFSAYVFCLLLLGMFFCRTIVVRWKAKRIFHSSMICRFFKKCFGRESRFMKFQRYIGSKIPFIWKAVLIYLTIVLVELVSLLFSIATDSVVIYLLIKICITFLFIYVISWLHELKKGGEELVAGNTKHKVNTRFMRWDFKEHGENLNNLNEGLQVAVEERMKSERMKTELITNVSHDIKTPLTSIINYVDLLQKQNITSEPEASYIDVLARQSARLKKLIEDLVDASKASSGSIAVEMKVMDANLVLTQATAEYVDKLVENNLILVVSESSGAALIKADGRHLWRVIDNLLNNAYKYAMPGTRVYAVVETADDRVQITVKNISKDQLNVSSDELMERFVRGDSSRNTEGSGLGLSIAKSLCQLMGADFGIEIDGDLYKAIITFDQVSEEEKMHELTEKES